MPLTSIYGFADAPNSAIIGDSSLAWTTATGALSAVGTSLTVASSAAFPAALEFDVIIGLRNTTTGIWSNAEVRHVSAVSGLGWTVSAGSLNHASGESISLTLTKEGLKHNPGPLTDTGDMPYLLSTGRMGRLAAPSDGTYSVAWLSGVPTWTAAGSGGISFADLATPPTSTALGSSAAPFGTLVVGTGGNMQYGTPTIDGDTGVYTLTIGPPELARLGLSTGIPLYILNQDDGVAHTDVYISSFVDPATKYAWAELDFQLVNSAGPVFRTLFLFGAEGNLADNGDVTNQDFYVYDAIADRNVLTITPTAAAFFGPVTAPDFVLSGGGTLATQSYVGSQGFVTGSSATAFTNKSGAISQWTNDASYTTLAAVAGVGYLTGVTAHNLLSATHGDTVADSVVRGDLLYGNSTPKWARLAKPSVLSGLSHDGTDVSWVTATGTGAPARATSPTFTTPILGVASATSLATSASSPFLLTNGQLVTIALTSQTVNPTTLTIPNFASVSDTFAFITLAQTFTNKRITKRVVTASDATSITPNSDSADVTYQANTQTAGTLTINADGGAPTNGQAWLLKIKSTNVQTFAWNGLFVGGTIALPTATTGGSTIDYFAFVYDTVNTKWHFTGSAAGF